MAMSLDYEVRDSATAADPATQEEASAPLAGGDLLAWLKSLHAQGKLKQGGKLKVTLPPLERERKP
jgi:hypothetical protein